MGYQINRLLSDVSLSLAPQYASNVAYPASGGLISVEAASACVGRTIHNRSNGDLYVRLGDDADASADDFTQVVTPSGYYETPFGYGGMVTADWDAPASGSVMVSSVMTIPPDLAPLSVTGVSVSCPGGNISVLGTGLLQVLGWFELSTTCGVVRGYLADSTSPAGTQAISESDTEVVLDGTGVVDPCESSSITLYDGDGLEIASFTYDATTISCP